MWVYQVWRRCRHYYCICNQNYSIIPYDTTIEAKNILFDLIVGQQENPRLIRLLVLSTCCPDRPSPPVVENLLY